MDSVNPNVPFPLIQQNQEESQQIGKTTLLLVCVVSVSIIGIGYFVFLQQQQLKCMFSLLIDDISKLNDKLSKCPVLNGTYDPSNCYGGRCEIPQKPNQANKPYEFPNQDYDITPECEYQIVMRNKPTPIILSSAAEYGDDEAESGEAEIEQEAYENTENKEEPQNKAEEPEEPPKKEKKNKGRKKKKKEENNANEE